MIVCDRIRRGPLLYFFALFLEEVCELVLADFPLAKLEATGRETGGLAFEDEEVEDLEWVAWPAFMPLLTGRRPLPLGK